jgi:hypothetical protein
MLTLLFWRLSSRFGPLVIGAIVVAWRDQMGGGPCFLRRKKKLEHNPGVREVALCLSLQGGLSSHDGLLQDHLWHEALREILKTALAAGGLFCSVLSVLKDGADG